MIQLLQKGEYRLEMSQDGQTVLYLGDAPYCWESGNAGQHLLTYLKFPSPQSHVLSAGEYRLYDVHDDPDLADLHHLELATGPGLWQGYLLLPALPTNERPHSRIEATAELVPYGRGGKSKEDMPAPARSGTHYYGDIVRLCFMVGAIIMLVGLPSVSNYLSVPTLLSIISILVLGLTAGFTNPRQVWDAGLNVVVASVGFLVFETYAVIAYRQYSAVDRFFLSNLVLGFIFMCGVYFSVKTFRGLWLERGSALEGGETHGSYK